MKFRFLSVVVFAALSLLPLLSVKADIANPSSKSEEEIAEARTYNNNDFLNDFFLMAGIKRVKEHSVSRNNFSLTPDLRSFLKEKHSWIYRLVTISEKKSSQSGLSRWDFPIYVSIGFPDSFSVSYNNDGEQFRVLHPNQSEMNGDLRLVSYLQGLIEDISVATNIKIQIADKNSELVNFRIVIVDDVGAWENSFKKRKFKKLIKQDVPPTPILFRDQIEQLFDKVEFTPELIESVDGYFIVNDKNQIVYASCYIWSGHPPSTLHALIRECAIRSMGLPYGVLKNISTAHDALNLLYDPKFDLGDSYQEIMDVLNQERE